MEAENSAGGATQLDIQPGIPPDMEHIDHDSNRVRIELAGQIQRLCQRHDYATVGGEHRMQRLDPEPDSALSSMWNNGRDSFGHHFARAVDIAVRRRTAHQ